MKAVIARADAGENALDRDFIAAHTNGFEAFAEDLRADRRGTAIETASGLTRSALDAVADAYIRSNATIVSYGMGVTQHEKGTQNVQQVAALLLHARQFRQARRRHLSAARPFQRAGQPHGRHHRKARSA